MKRMLINATQTEERRLAIVDGQKLLDYEIEVEGREQRKGNIYKAVVTRVEPSLEACFVDYGEDRHGFLPFKEISRNYFAAGVPVGQARINDVIREGQELMVQVEKEERGNKGAALTTFVSLAGRYVVLMPNNPRGGGVSRRIEGDDRAELKEAMDQLEYPAGSSIIARTAGIGRSAPELQWDLNYLIKLWTAIEGAGKNGKGAFLIYQESSLVIRAIRDYFNSDIGDILFDTDDVYEQARQFMAHVMPEHEHRVKRYRDDAPLFSRFQIEHQIESAYARTVQLPSGGAIVIDHTEALVSVDVNSARAIKGGDIEETATRTNLEAADEVARQMRLRDLGGLIVIDFIDMEESRNRRDVENRLRDALRQDRARVQFGTISKFGLMEMSRQRLRPALSEGASIPCPRCGGSGHIRDTESSALQILRIIQEESMKDSTASVLCQVPVDVASFLLNEKRSEIAKIEMKQRINVLLVPNKTLETPNYKLERLKHDDPRLDNIEASYKMAEEIEDPTLVTRRSQEKHNKQEPVIKGVLPDMPAPIVVPKPEVAAKPAAQQRSPLAARTPAAPAAEKGFFGWLKNLFAGDDAAPVAAPGKEVKKDERGEGRRDERGERGERSERGERGGRDARRGGRGGRSERTEGRPERTGERGAERGEGRADPRRERSPEGRAEGRPERVPAEGRAEGGRGADRSGEARPDLRTEGRNEGRAESQPRSEGQPRGEGRGDRPRRERPERAERTDRGERGAERSGAPRDAAQEELALANQAAMAAAARGDVTAPEAGREERQPREAREPREPRESRGEGRRERGGRRQERRDDAPAADGSQAAFADGNAPDVRAERTERTEQTVATDAAPQGNEATAGQDDAQERAPRERRSRDRYGRERRERGDRAESSPEQAVDADASTPAFTPVQMTSAETVPAAAFMASPVVNEVPAAPAAVAAPAPQVASAPAPAARALPQVASYDLPLQDLAQVASASGLQWVNSNTSKIAETQAAMAAEPRLVHVPRERAPVVAVPASPLVLVETKRDLSNMTLPFEETAAKQPPQ
ncbi:MAG: Rne/Rng family ribonuclease [Polaromonas sp.]|nr:Rne/Rng family ribonuclease [Polaromonas sp.]